MYYLRQKYSVLILCCRMISLYLCNKTIQESTIKQSTIAIRSFTIIASESQPFVFDNNRSRENTKSTTNTKYRPHATMAPHTSEHQAKSNYRSLTESQKNVLHQYYQRCQFVTHTRLKDIASRTGLDKDLIEKWFHSKNSNDQENGKSIQYIQ